MSSSRRPWFPWYPRDYVSDEKTRGLSDDADLLYRRILDIIWQANDLQLPNICSVLHNQIARGWSIERFENAWNEIQRPKFELLKVSDCSEWITSNRLQREAEKIENISKIRSESGKKAKAKQKPSKSQAKAKQKRNHTHTHTDIEIDKSISIQGAESIYKAYLEKIDPVQKSHQRAIKNIAHYLKTNSFDDLMCSISNYETVASSRERKFRKDPANFFGKSEPGFMDYLPGSFKPDDGNESCGRSVEPKTYAQAQDHERRMIAKATLDYLEGSDHAENNDGNSDGRAIGNECGIDGQEAG